MSFSGREVCQGLSCHPAQPCALVDRVVASFCRAHVHQRRFEGGSSVEPSFRIAPSRGVFFALFW